AYIVVPTDIIPDKIPFIGKIDELAVAFFALNSLTSFLSSPPKEIETLLTPTTNLLSNNLKSFIVKSI
ncbi:DUF1232 domain-containing protein, partial [Clostridium saudiense]|nr:DUF1232 domain-containing protein [Clostridium saudiense]